MISTIIAWVLRNLSLMRLSKPFVLQQSLPLIDTSGELGLFVILHFKGNQGRPECAFCVDLTDTYRGRRAG